MTTFYPGPQARSSGIKLLRSALVCGGLLTGFAGLFGGASAQAAPVVVTDTCSFGPLGGDCAGYTTSKGRLGDKIFSVVKPPNQGEGHVDFTWIDYAGNGVSLDDDWVSTIDWGSGGLIGPTAGGNFDYTLSIDPASGYSFGLISLDSSELGSGGTTATKEIFKGLTDTSSLGVLTSVNGGHDDLNLAGTGIQQLYIRDGWSVDADHSLATLTNGFEQVPGPLPLLGAAAAFGWSRKLRRRVGTFRLG